MATSSSMDYSALAEKYGAMPNQTPAAQSSSQQASAGLADRGGANTAVDYAALAKQNGALGTVDPEDHTPWLQKLDRFANTPAPGAWKALFGPVGNAVALVEHYAPQMQQAIEHEISSGNPYRAGIASFLINATKSTSDLAASSTTPLAVATAPLAAEGVVAQAGRVLFGTYMAVRGTNSALHGQLQGELLPDMVERRLMGAATAAGGAAAAVSPVKDMTRHFVRNSLGIDGNLANVVIDKVRNAEQMRTNTETVAGIKTSEVADSLASIDQEAGMKKSEISDQAAVDRASVRTNAEEAAADVSKTSQENVALNQKRQLALDAERQARAKRIIADASQAVDMERARVSQPFKDIAAEHTEPVTDASELRQTIVNAVEDFGVNAEEIPKRAFAAMGDRGRGFDEITMNGVKGRMSDLPQSVQDSLRNSGALPDDSMRFGDLIRVKDDLYAAMKGSQDGALRAGFASAIEKVDGMLDEFAGKKGFGDKWKRAKGEYATFQRELNSPVMRDWLAAGDISEQALTPKIAKLTTSVDAEAIRTVLRRTGIDVGPLDHILRELKTTEAALKTAPKMLQGALDDIFGSANKEVSGITKNADKQLSAIEKTRQQSAKGELDAHTSALQELQATAQEGIKGLNQDTLVPGTGDLDLAGVSDSQIKVLRLQQLFAAAKANGLTRPMNFFTTVISIMKMAKYGALGYGNSMAAGKLLLTEMVNKKAFQDWVVRDSGVEPTNKLLAFRLKQGLADLYPVLRQLSAVQSVDVQAAQGSLARDRGRAKPGRRILPPQSQVAKATY